MAFDYTGWKAKVGKILGALNEVNTYRGTTLSGRVTTLLGQYPVTDALNPAIGGIYDAQTAGEQAMNGWITYLSSLLSDTTIRQLNADRTILDTSLSAAIAELERRMLVDSQSFNDCPATITPANVGSPTGDHQLVWSSYEYTGIKSPYIVPDVFLIQLTNDRSSGGTQWKETFSLAGKAADDLPTDASYPSGTGLNTSFVAVDPGSDGGVVTDGTFDLWSSSNTNTPTDWTIYSGTAGTNVFRTADDPRNGASGFALRFLGDGATVLKVRQEVTVDAESVYNVHLRVKKVTDPGTDWAVSVLLTDTNGTALAGPASYTNTISSAACSSLSSDWANPVTGTFITPAVLPVAGVFLEIRFHQSGSLTTAAANTADAYVDHVSMQSTNQLYAGGPVQTCFSGIVEGVRGDTRTATLALASGVPADYVIRGMDRLLGLASLPARLPVNTAAGETISDSVIS